MVQLNAFVIAIVASNAAIILAAPTSEPKLFGPKKTAAPSSIFTPFRLGDTLVETRSIWPDPFESKRGLDTRQDHLLFSRGLHESYPRAITSQDENQVADRIGASAYYYMVVCVSSALFYGIALSLFYASLRVSSQRREGSSKARKFLFALTTFMFLGNTGFFVTSISYAFELFSWVRVAAITENTPPLQDRLVASFTGAIPYHVCQGVFEISNFVVGDAIVIWRAVVLWPESRPIQGGLWSLLLGDVVVSLYVMFNSSAAIMHSKNVTTWVASDSARILVSFAVNFLATLCIGVKAWQFRQTLRLGFSRAATRKSLVNHVLTLLVECGLLFCAFQLVYAIYNHLIVPKSNNSSPISALNLSLAGIGPFFSFFAGMYPSLVIVVMAEQKSVFGTSTFVAFSHSSSESSGTQTDQHQSRVLSTLQFASEPTATGFTESEVDSVTDSVEETSKGNISVSLASVSEKASV